MATRWFTDALRRLRGERGAVAAMAAVMLTGLVGMVGLSVDLGMLYVAKSELQNAADAAALAGADSLVGSNGSGEAVAQPETAVNMAKEVSLANQALKVSLTLLDQDITMGLWDFALGDFDPAHIGPSGDPDELTAFRAKVRRDETANTPVPTFFAGLLGLAQAEVSATSVALLGWAGSAPEGTVDLPIAVKADALNDGNGPLCGNALEFHDEGNENAEWTTFFTWPTNDPAVRQYITGAQPSPPLQVGDEISVINGNLSNHAFADLRSRFLAEGDDTDGDGEADWWPVTLPVMEPNGSSTSATVAGFANMIITGVSPAPDKNITGFLLCGMVQDGSVTGGGNYGTRADAPKLVQ